MLPSIKLAPQKYMYPVFTLTRIPSTLREKGYYTLKPSALNLLFSLANATY